MTPTELRALLLATGLSSGEFARRLGINAETVRKMLAGRKPIPDGLGERIACMFGAGGAASAVWPRDEWIVGEGPPPERREYVVHTTAPRFIARVVALDVITDTPEPDEEPVDLDGVTYQSLDSLLCEIVWIDPAPTDPTALRRLIDRAADQLEWDG